MRSRGSADSDPRRRTIQIDASRAPPAPPRCRSAPPAHSPWPLAVRTAARRPRPCRPAGRWPRWSRFSRTRERASPASWREPLAASWPTSRPRCGGHGAGLAGLGRVRARTCRGLRPPTCFVQRAPTSPAAVGWLASHGDGRKVVPRSAAATDIDRSWLRHSWTSFWSDGVSCSTTSWPPSIRPCAGETSSGRCVAWRIAGGRRRPVRAGLHRRAVRSAGGRGPADHPPSRADGAQRAPVRTDPLNLTGVVLPGERVPARSTEWFDLPA